MWGRGLRGSNGACSILCWFSVTPSATHNQSGPFWCCFLGGWVCVHSRTLWASPTNSPMGLGVSPAAASTPTSVFSQWFEVSFPCTGTLSCKVCHPIRQLLPRQPAAVLPTPLHNLPPHWVRQSLPFCESSLPWLPISAPPTGLDECVFFISLGWTSIQFDFLSVLVVFCF